MSSLDLQSLERRGSATASPASNGARGPIRRALLCVPPTGLFVREDRCHSAVSEFAVNFPRPPMDLLTAAAYLEASGVEVSVRDYPMLRRAWDDYQRDLRELRPELVLVSATTSRLDEDLSACALAKRHDPRVLTCAKGVVGDGLATLAAHPLVDVVLRGENLEAVAELARGTPAARIAGLAYRENGEGRLSAEFAPHADLDILPIPAFHLVDPARYVRPDTGEPCAHIETHRGCPAHCIFCLVGPVYGYEIRAKSPPRVVDEVEHCVKRLGIRSFHFKADTFTWDKRYVLDVCDEIARRNLEVEWFCNSRVDTIDAERLVAMKRAGCFAVSFGIESGSEVTLRRIRKGITPEQCRSAIALCREHGVRTYTYFMIGFPWETAAEVRETLAFARELDGDFADIFVAYPFPGTAYERLVRAEGLLVAEASGDAYAGASIRTRAVSAVDLERLRRWGLLRFYLRPRYVARTLRSARDPRVAANYVRHGLRLLRVLAARSGGAS